jgi:hypothetical protein
MLSGTFMCGGQLVAKASTRLVTVTYVASAVSGGGMSCALVVLRVHLTAPVGTREVLDGATHKPLELVTATR